MQKTKTETLLGFAVRAREIIFGADNILSFKKTKYLVLCDTDLSENTRRKLAEYAKAQHIPLLLPPFPLCDALHRDGVKAVALTDSHMAAEIIKDLAKSEA